MKFKLKIVSAIALLIASATMVWAVAVTATSTGTEFAGIRNTCKSYHITAKETNTPVSQTARLYYVGYNVSGAGTSWTLTVQDKTSGTALILTSVTLATGSGAFQVVGPIPAPGAVMNGGYDIVTGGTTAGTMDLWTCFR